MPRPDACTDSPIGKHETIRTLIFIECVHCGEVEYL